jgi:hypothetical protein
MIAVTAAVVYKGDKEDLSGNFTLVIWRNLTDPFLLGRELPAIDTGLIPDVVSEPVLGFLRNLRNKL